jgi:hypothetical protein
MRRSVHAAMDQVHQCGARVDELFIKPWSFNRGPMALIERSEGVSYGSNRGRQHGNERWGFIPPKEVVAQGLHGGTLFERGGSPKWYSKACSGYGLWLPAVPRSNQSGGQGVLTKWYSTACSGGVGHA